MLHGPLYGRVGRVKPAFFGSAQPGRSYVMILYGAASPESFPFAPAAVHVQRRDWSFLCSSGICRWLACIIGLEGCCPGPQCPVSSKGCLCASFGYYVTCRSMKGTAHILRSVHQFLMVGELVAVHHGITNACTPQLHGCRVYRTGMLGSIAQAHQCWFFC